MNSSYILSAVILVAASSEAMGQISSESFNPLEGWTEVSQDVFTRTEKDGSISRIAFGANGAAHDLGVLEREYADIRSARQLRELSDVEVSAERDLLSAMESLAYGKNAGGIAPRHSSGGALCGDYGYYFDSHIGVGNLGTSALARAYASGGWFGPTPIPPDKSTVFQSATIKAGAATVGYAAASDEYYYSSYYYPQPASVAHTNHFWGSTPTDCSATIFSYVSLQGGLCSTPAYVSYTRNYTCNSLTD